VSVDDAEDSGQLTDAVQTAVDHVLNEAIAFQPTVIMLTHAMVIGNRLYVRLLLADKEGEQTFSDLAPGHEAPAASATDDIKI
jgi:hypothetical protein